MCLAADDIEEETSGPSDCIVNDMNTMLSLNYEYPEIKERLKIKY